MEPSPVSRFQGRAGGGTAVAPADDGSSFDYVTVALATAGALLLLASTTVAVRRRRSLAPA